MINFRFGSAAAVSRFDQVDDEGRWWYSQNPDYARHRRVPGRAGSLFVAHYKAGDTSENPTGLACAVVFIGIDGGILYRAVIVPDDGLGMQRCQLLVSALCELTIHQRAAWATNRIARLADTKPYMSLGLEGVPLEVIVEDQSFRTKLTNLLAFYTERDRSMAERAFLRASFLCWLTDTARTTSMHPSDVLRQLDDPGFDPGTIRAMLPDHEPVPYTVQIMPHGTEAVMDLIASQTQTPATPQPHRPPATPGGERRRRRTSLSFLDDPESDTNDRASNEVQERPGGESGRRRPSIFD